MNPDMKLFAEVFGVVLAALVGVPTARFIWGAAVEWGARGESIKNTDQKLNTIGEQLSTHVDEVRNSFVTIQEAAEKTRAEFTDIKRGLEQQAKDQRERLTDWTEWRKKMDGHVVRIDKRIDDHDRRVGPDTRRKSTRKGGRRDLDTQE